MRFLFVTVLCALSFVARAELTIEISQGVNNPTAIAVAPFAVQGKMALPVDMSRVISSDLHRSGLFRPIPERDMLSFPHSAEEVHYRDWRILGAEYLLIGNIFPTETGQKLSIELFDVVGGKSVLRRDFNGSTLQLRDLAHAVSDLVYETITGIPGVFSTHIAYVSERRGADNKPVYKLMLSDADGAREQVLLESRKPIMSPHWSPDGKALAYVSFETGRPAIFRQEIATAKRERLTNFRGLNNAPVWSPDGKFLAMVLSKDGNPNVYLLEMATRKFTRITHHWAIDTEPAWNPDGKSLIFTSDRGGKPQIYRYTLASGEVERVTFSGDYNARGRITADGKTLVFVHRYNGIFHIATQDLQSGLVRVLTETRLDESPTIAPNSAILLYATKQNGRGILAAVSLDAGVKYLLPSMRGSVREPAWSPYRQ